MFRRRVPRETGRVDVKDLDADPLRQLSAWLDAARTAGQPMPEAMTIASATSEMEAISIKNLLDSNGIAAVLVGDSVLPNFPFEVRVARDQGADPFPHDQIVVGQKDVDRARGARRGRARVGLIHCP